MGASREARRRRLGRHLHARQPRLSALALAPTPGKLAPRLSRARLFALSTAARSGQAQDARPIHTSSRSGARWRRRAMPTCYGARACSAATATGASSMPGGGALAARLKEQARKLGIADADRLARRARSRAFIFELLAARRPLRPSLPARPLRRPRRPAERADGGAGLRRAGACDGCFRHPGARDAWQDRLACAASATRSNLPQAIRRLIDDAGFASAPRRRPARSACAKKFSSEPGIDFVARKLGVVSLEAGGGMSDDIRLGGRRRAGACACAVSKSGRRRGRSSASGGATTTLRTATPALDRLLALAERFELPLALAVVPSARRWISPSA